jgi:hypothetical protein
MQYPDFLTSCDKANIGLSPDLEGNPRDILLCYQPNEWCGAVAVAGTRLREENFRVEPITLANNVIPETLISDNPTIAEKTLRTIVNASIDRVPLTDTNYSHSFYSYDPNRTHTCRDSEARFQDTFDAMLHPEHQLEDPNGAGTISWSIIAEDGEAFAIRKTLGESLTLLLKEAIINGIPYPPGSLCNMSTLNRTRKNPAEKVLISTEQIAFAGFLRLSAYAWSPRQRSTATNVAPSTRMGDVIQNWTIDDMIDVAQNAAEYAIDRRI